MLNKTRVFMSGRSQHVTIQAAYRFRSSVVSIRRDPQNGDVILSEVPTLADVSLLSMQLQFPRTSLAKLNRDQRPPEDRPAVDRLFADEDSEDRTGRWASPRTWSTQYLQLHRQGQFFGGLARVAQAVAGPRSRGVYLRHHRSGISLRNGQARHIAGTNRCDRGTPHQLPDSPLGIRRGCRLRANQDSTRSERRDSLRDGHAHAAQAIAAAAILVTHDGIFESVPELHATVNWATDL
jgi:virulence-associated protein VagC